MNDLGTVRIVGTGSSLGTTRLVELDAESLGADPSHFQDLGIERYLRSDLSLVELAAQAALAACDDAKIRLSEVDLLIVAADDVPEFLCWDFSTAVSTLMGIPNVRSLAISQGCVGGLLVVERGRQELLCTHTKTVVVVAANKHSDAHRSRMRMFDAVMSDGAAAAVLRQAEEGPAWIGLQHFSRGRYVDLHKIPFGGAANPEIPPNWDPAKSADGKEQAMDIFADDPQTLADFASDLRRMPKRVTLAAAEQMLVDERFDWLLYTHESPYEIQRLATELGISPSRTNAPLSARWGHIGAADQLASMNELLQQKQFSVGDNVALTTYSTGMHWACATVRM